MNLAGFARNEPPGQRVADLRANPFVRSFSAPSSKIVHGCGGLVLAAVDP